jgi:hypothetical protein
LRGLKHEALAELQLCLALLRSLLGAHGNVLSAADIDDGDPEVCDGGAFVARADEHGERAPVNRVNEDEIGGEIVERHLEAGGLGGDVAGKEVDEIEAGHLHTGRLLHTLGVRLEEITC